jgi:hypothetical protein
MPWLRDWYRCVGNSLDSDQILRADGMKISSAFCDIHMSEKFSIDSSSSKRPLKRIGFPA